MATVKLTKAMRNEIIFSITAEGIVQRIKDCEVELRKAGTAVIKSVLKEYWDTMYSLPEGFFSIDTSFYLEREEILTESIRCPACYKFGNIIGFSILTATDEQKAAIDNYRIMRKKYNDLRREKGHIEIEANSILNSVSTVKQLLEVWPEVEKYLPYTAKSVDNRSLPMVQVRQLNDKLELYKEKKE